MQIVKRQTNRALCERCGQELTDPESIKRGMGPECSLTAGAQFAAITNLVSAMANGWIDPVATKFLTERQVVEAVHNRARRRADFEIIKRTTKRLRQIDGILVRRELLRIERTATQQEVA